MPSSLRRRLRHPCLLYTSYKVAYGDVDKAFAKAAHVVHEDLWVHRGAAHSMEGRGILAQISGPETVIWASTQKAHDLRNALADYVALDESRLRVATPDVGGGFGPKLCVYPEDVATVAAATLLRRSVKWIEDRREHFTNAAQERDQYWSIELAADADGRVRGVRGRLIHDIGAYALQDVNIPYNSATTLTGPYVVPALAIDVAAIHTNKAPVSSVRGAGYPQAAFAMERMMDRFWEAHDFILKAMTTHDETFNWEGEFFHYRQVNIWPRVWQEPHPPVWSTTGSTTQARVLGERGYVMATLGTGYGTRKIYDAYRKSFRTKFGHAPGADRFAYLGLVAVSHDRDEAKKRGHLIAGYLRTSPIVALPFRNPPGYIPPEDNARMLRGETPPRTYTKDGLSLIHI